MCLHGDLKRPAIAIGNSVGTKWFAEVWNRRYGFWPQRGRRQCIKSSMLPSTSVLSLSGLTSWFDACDRRDLRSTAVDA